MNFIIETKNELTDSLIAGVLVSALEGGIGYWACIEDITVPEAAIHDPVEKGWLRMTPDLSYPSYITAPLIGGSVTIGDNEDDQHADEHPKLYTVDRVAIARGLHLMANGTYRRHFNDILAENYDVVTGDVLIQLAVFGEVKYG